MWGLFVVLEAIFAIFLMFSWFHIKKRPKTSYKQPTSEYLPQNAQEERVVVTWIGHSTLFINLYGYKILTDPVWSERVGVGFSIGKKYLCIGPKRHTAPALSLEQIGTVDLILLSHAHMDHFDLPTLRQLANPKTMVITAKGTSRLLKGLPFGKVMELGGKERVALDNGVAIQAVPVKHWGNRYPWNRNYGYTGYLIERNNTRLLFPGDTAYTSFQWLRELGDIDLAFMPIGAYHPESFQFAHCTPEQAWQMFIESGAKWFVPIHWDTFVLSYEPVEEPLERLFKAAGDEKDRIVLTCHGQVFTLVKNEVTV